MNMPTFQQILQSFNEGGPVMWPILILSIVGVAIVFDRLYAFYVFFHARERAADPQATLNRLQRGFGLLSTAVRFCFHRDSRLMEWRLHELPYIPSR